MSHSSRVASGIHGKGRTIYALRRGAKRRRNKEGRDTRAARSRKKGERERNVICDARMKQEEGIGGSWKRDCPTRTITAALIRSKKQKTKVTERANKKKHKKGKLKQTSGDISPLAPLHTSLATPTTVELF